MKEKLARQVAKAFEARKKKNEKVCVLCALPWIYKNALCAMKEDCLF